LLLANVFHPLPALVRVPRSRGRKEAAAVSTCRNFNPAKIKGQQPFAFFYVDTAWSGNSPAQESRPRYIYESTTGFLLGAGLGKQTSTHTLNSLYMWVQHL